jgi:acid phosphatase
MSEIPRRRFVSPFALALAATLALGACVTEPAGPPADDNLNAVLWTQRSVEFKGNALTAFALARLRLDQALADRNWTAAPVEQTGNYQNLPPAVVLDVDETLLDNSNYQAWNVIKNTSFDSKTWTTYVNSKTSVPIPGAVEFTQYAESKGVKVFYVTNRTFEEEPPTKELMQRQGFAMGGNVDTFLSARKRPDWGSAKGTRRAVIAKDYRILLLLGDNFGDFVDAYRGSEAERQKVFEDNRARWGREWIVTANPTYGSFESAPYAHDFKKSPEEQRALKRGVLTWWPGP